MQCLTLLIVFSFLVKLASVIPWYAGVTPQEAACLWAETLAPDSLNSCFTRFLGTTGPPVVPTKCTDIIADIEETSTDLNEKVLDYQTCLADNGYNLVDATGTVLHTLEDQSI